MTYSSHIGVLTSGGDSPGMNAAIRAVVRTAHFHGVRTSGIMGGYDGLINGHFRELGPRDVSNIIQRGGTMLRSARSEEFRTPEGRAKAADRLQQAGIDAIVAIGGDGGGTVFTVIGERQREVRARRTVNWRCQSTEDVRMCAILVEGGVCPSGEVVPPFG